MPTSAWGQLQELVSPFDPGDLRWVADSTGAEIVRRKFLTLLALGAVLAAACSPQSSSQTVEVASPSASLGSNSSRASADPCVTAATRLGSFTSQMVDDLASLRPLVVAAAFDPPGALAVTRRVAGTITSYAGIDQGLLACQETGDLGPRVARLVANAQAALAKAFSAEVTDGPVQRDAAASLFGLLPEVQLLASADQAISNNLGIAIEIAEVPKGADDPVGSLPPFPTPMPTPTPFRTADPFVALPRLSVRIWHASVRYFSIGGKNPGQLETSDQKNIPRAAEGDKVPNAFAYTEVATDSLQPTYIADPFSGSCTMLGLTGKLTYRVTIPRWISPARVLPQLLSWWKLVLEHVRWHEEQHVRIFEKWVPVLAKRFAGKPCSSATSIETRWSADMTAAQNAFDFTERTWYLRYPYNGPWIN